MLQIIKELFLPKTVVGLHAAQRTVTAVQVSSPLGSPVVERIASEDLSVDEGGPKQDTFLERQKLSPEVVITCLPSSSAFIRELSIPFESPKKLDRIIKYQMEPLLPCSVETMVVDHLPAFPERPILSVAAQKSMLSAFLESLSTSGISPGVVTLDALAIYGLYLRVHPEPRSGAVTIAYLGTEGSVVLVVEGTTLALVRVLKESGAAEIRQTLDLYRVKTPNVKIEQILVTGDASGEHTVAALHKATDVDVVPWRPFDSIRHKLGEIDTKTQALFTLPLGLAIGSFAAPLKGFNLRREEFALESTSRLKGTLAYTATALLALMALVTFTAFHGLNTSRKEHSALRAEIHSTFKAAFPDVPNIVKGMELEQMKQKILDGTKEYKWLQALTERGPALDVLLTLTRHLSGFKDVKLDNLSVEGKRVDLDGRASSFQTVDNLKSVLERAGIFTQVKLVGAKMDSRDKTVRFNFVMERQA
ncbi:MAG: hypothetical protein C4576_16750 [Desulfobacteraceae bacterium]|nr:MAG: hypothetical protein C4576_16750 [Desulfobacteraceae bacterium]